VERLRDWTQPEAPSAEALVVLNATDPANLFGPALSLPAEPGGGEQENDPARFSWIPPNYLVLLRGRPVLLLERRALHQLHHDEGDALCFPGVVNRSDVGVVELGGRLGFAQKAGATFVVQGGLGEDLDRDVPLEHGVVTAIYDPHAAPADLGIKAVALAEEGANRCRHQTTHQG
jgi:hypothetical protein